MGGPRIEIAPELVAEGKRLYEQTQTSQEDIAGMMGISRDTLRARVREWGWKQRPPRSRPLDHPRAVIGAAMATASDALPAAGPISGYLFSTQHRAALAVRIQNVVEREMTAVERLLDKAGASDLTAGGASARALAAIARTLREITALNTPEDATSANDTDDDTIPVDLDALRCELARRIVALVKAERSGGGEDRDSDTTGTEAKGG